MVRKVRSTNMSSTGLLELEYDVTAVVGARRYVLRQKQYSFTSVFQLDVYAA